MDEAAEAIEDIAQAIVAPPDGGYGWVIVTCSFFCNMIVDGMIFTCGAGFQPKWEQHFNVSSAYAAWAVSLLSGFYCLVGPIVSALANMFGCQRVVLAGTVIAFIGFVASMFAPNMPFLLFTFGILGGIGFGFIFMPSIVIVSYYFSKRRALATGIAVCGSGIGTFVFAPLIDFLLEEYSWPWALLVLSAITLNCGVFGYLYKMPEPTKEQIKHLQELYQEEQEYVKSCTSVNNPDGDGGITNGIARRRRPSRTVTMSGAPTSEAGYRDSTFTGLGPGRFMDTTGRVRQYSLFSLPDSADAAAAAGGAGKLGLLRGVSAKSISKLNRPLARSDIFFQGSLSRLPEFKAATRKDSQDPLDVMKYIASTTHIDEILELEEAEAIGGMAGLKDTVWATLRSLLNPELARSPSFIVLSLSGFLTLTGFFVPFIYLPRYATSLGINHAKATSLVQILGVTNIVGRIFCGWLSDQPRMNALLINNVALTLGGVATIILPWLNAYWMLVVYCVVFGFATACFAALRSVICVELLGLERLNNAFGLMLLFLGLASLVGSPIAGALYDATGNYSCSFYVTGSLVALSGIIGFPLKTISNWENKRDDLIDTARTEDTNATNENGKDTSDHQKNSMGKRRTVDVELVEVIAEDSESVNET